MDQQFGEKILAKTRADYDRIASSFAETRERSHDLQLLVERVKSGERVLDVGCGNGRLLGALPVGVHYSGCDTSKTMIAVAENRLVIPLPNTQFVFGDVLALPFPDASFDHVFALAVLHHIPSDALRQQAVSELTRVVRSGGRVVITVWNLRNVYWMRRYRLWRLLFGLHPRGYDRGDCLVPWKRGLEKPIARYVHAFTQRELHSLFDAEALKIVQASSGRNHTVIVEKVRG